MQHLLVALIAYDNTIDIIFNLNENRLVATTAGWIFIRLCIYLGLHEK